MKQLLLALLLASFATSSSLADSPDAILKDYRKQAAQAVERLNQSLEKAATPMITKLVQQGDTAGAELLTAQLKDKIAGEPVSSPQASATQLFSLYDDARAKALAPVQKSSVARIDSLLKTAGGAKLETVTELGKVREEIDAGRLHALPSLPVEWSFRRTPTGVTNGIFMLKPDGTAEMKGGGGNLGKWKLLKQTKTISVEWANPKDTWTVTFQEGNNLAEVHSLVWSDTRYLVANQAAKAE